MAPAATQGRRHGPGALYRDKLLAVEPGGCDAICPDARHGVPRQLLWTWMAPNLEFATVFVGVLAVSSYGMSFWPAVAGLALGTGLAAVAHFILSARGPRYGVPQMVLGRLAFGFRGNALPSLLMAVTAGVGWFAANSVSGAFALAALLHVGPVVPLVPMMTVQTALAFCGHNLVQAFQRWTGPVLAAVFAVTSIAIFVRAQYGAAPPAGGIGGTGGFLLTVGTAFGCAAGWNPYAADYTRYLPRSVSSVRTGLYAAGGLFLACVSLEAVGAASVTIGPPLSANPATAFTAHLPAWVATATLLAIAVGAVAANCINLYSGAMAFIASGIPLSRNLSRPIVTAALGVCGFLVAWWALDDAAASYEAFLLLIAYWVGPWLGVVLADQYLRPSRSIDGLLHDRSHSNRAGVAAFVIGLAASVMLFARQNTFVGLASRHLPQLGDITFFVGFAVAAIVYALVRKTERAGERSRRQ